MEKKAASEYATKIWNDTQDAIDTFVAVSSKCKISESITRKCLGEMINNALKANRKAKREEADNE